MAKADPFAQHRLLELAELDRSVAAGLHRRANLPELAQIEAAQRRSNELASEQILAETEVADLTKAERKLSSEIDQVRARSSETPPGFCRELRLPRVESLEQEIASLARRQGVLEDEALELMERQENAEAALAAVRTLRDELNETITAAQSSRDAAFVEIDGNTAQLANARVGLVDALPADLVTLYERIRSTGKVAAARLVGDRCEACRMGLDRNEVNEIRAASPDEVKRCPECGAILVRS